MPRTHNDIRFDNGRGPAEEPFRLLRSHVDTTVALGTSVIAVPICAVEGYARVMEVGYPGYAWEFISLEICSDVPISHMTERHFLGDVKLTPWCRGRDSIGLRTRTRSAACDPRSKNQTIMFVRHQLLASEGDVDSFSPCRHSGG